MPVRAIAYASEAMPGLSVDQVDHIARDAERFNFLAGVTGILLFDGSRFMQYIEGPDDGIAGVYSRILASRSHNEVMELGRATVGRRRFPYWSMRLLRISEIELRTLGLCDWTALCRPAMRPGSPSGVDRLEQIVVPHLSSPDLAYATG